MKNKAFIAILALAVGMLASLFVGAAPVTEANGNCQISSFYASPQSVIAGGMTTLYVTSSNCQNLLLTGGNYSNYPLGSNTSLTVGPIYSSMFYTLTGTDSYGIPTTASTTVSVGGSGNGACQISSFYATPTQLASGASSSLYWNTNGCTNVNVTGPNVNSTQYSGSISTGPVYGTSTYSITASSYGSNQVTQSVTLYAGGTNNGNGTALAQTNPATNVTNTSATLNGYLSTNNSCGTYYYTCGTPTNFYFIYGTNSVALTQQTQTQTALSGANNVTAQIYNLQPNTTYYYELAASQNGTMTYGSVMSFFTSGNNYYPTPVIGSPVTAMTSIATEVTANSAQLNGLVTGGQGSTVTTYFEYGTTPSFGNTTPTQNVSTYSVNNYYSTISVSPNTTYYFRIDGISNGQTFPGATESFTTPGTNNYYVPPVVYTNPRPTTGGGSSYVSLSITDGSQNIFPGNTLTYMVNYQNISSTTLSGAIMNVILPSNVAFQSASQGVVTTNNTVAVTLGTLAPGAQGMVNITVVPNAVITPGTTLVATATLAFTTPSRAQDSAIAYAINSIASPNTTLAGLAFYGTGFFPNTLIGWVLLLGILLIIVLMARYFYSRGNRLAAQARPETHIHYGATPPPTQPITDKYGDPMYH